MTDLQESIRESVKHDYDIVKRRLTASLSLFGFLPLIGLSFNSLLFVSTN